MSDKFEFFFIQKKNSKFKLKITKKRPKIEKVPLL